MFFRHVLLRILSVLIPLSILATTYLYLYPIFHGCAFPLSYQNTSTTSTFSPALLATIREHLGFPSSPESHADKAPFRLLVLADPQIEGDSSLPGPNNGLPQRLAWRWKRIISAETPLDRLTWIAKSVRDVLIVDIPRSLRAVQKRLDLFGNDFYLAHIYRTLRWWTRPTHVAVLGDLIGSQWVTDNEFKVRSWRYWNRVFKGGVRVDDNITVTGSKDFNNDIKPGLLQLDDLSWSDRVINIAGNHDIGYAGDITEARIKRFDRDFGRANWDVRFEYLAPNSIGILPTGSRPTLHLIVLNSLSLDTPALTPSIQSQTYAFLNDAITHRSYPVEDRTSFTLLLTHLPLHKKEGVCTDAPYFSFHSEDDDKSDTGMPRFKAGGLKEQNHLSDYVSHNGILQGVFGMSGNRNAPAGGRGRNGLILTGHDHTGCDVIHFVDRQVAKGDGGSSDDTHDWTWNAQRYSSLASPIGSPSIREVTLRSMMGEYGGYAGLLSIWFDSDPLVQEWRYEIMMCALGVQHIWWAIHTVDLIAIVTLLVYIYLCIIQPGDAVERDAPMQSGYDLKNTKSNSSENEAKANIKRK
ncbi:hypothetical protein VTO42DRAFT_4507 [Malbranchea cinnamomea]